MHKGRQLRTGYTTGTCAAAAARGALMCLLGRRPGAVEIELPCGEAVTISVLRTRRRGCSAECAVIKDAGDDPDVTNGAVIQASVRMSDASGVSVKGGAGVGVVTRPGLAVAPGEAAINPVPLGMISRALAGLLPPGRGAEVIISVEGGEALAARTLNPRLGITGGISILGTTGIVVPYSHAAYRESIICALDVMCALGIDTAVFSTGKSSERAAQRVFDELPEAAFILMADYFAFAAAEAARHGLRRMAVACFPGKLLKMAAGAACTHYRSASIDLEFLAELAEREGAGRQTSRAVAQANTVRHAIGLVSHDMAAKLCGRMARLAGKRIQSLSGGSLVPEVLVVSYSRNILLHESY